jgi:hypothetical protein
MQNIAPWVAWWEPPKKEKNQYINDSGLAISVEEHKKVVMNNQVLAEYIWEIQPQLEDLANAKELISTLQSRLELQWTKPEYITDFISVMEESRSEGDGAAKAGIKLVEMMWVEFDRIFPGLWWKFYQMLNEFGNPWTVPPVTATKKKQSDEEELNKKLKWMFKV